MSAELNPNKLKNPAKSFLAKIGGEFLPAAPYSITIKRDGERAHVFEHHAPYVRFPENPQIITVQGREVFAYIGEDEMKVYLEHFYQSVTKLLGEVGPLEHAFVNLDGGRVPHKLLKEHVPAYAKLSHHEIAYRRPPGGFGVRVDSPVPSGLRGVPGVVPESCIDTGGVAEGIREHLQNAIFLPVVYKNGVSGQILCPNTIPVVVIDNVWYGGCGADFNRSGYPEDFPRSYQGVVVMPESLRH
jgi:hypothetical protein